MFNSPIVINEFEDENIEDDYKKISKNFKDINMHIVLSLLTSMSLFHIVIVSRRFGRLFIIYMVPIKISCLVNLWYRRKLLWMKMLNKWRIDNIMKSKNIKIVIQFKTFHMMSCTHLNYGVDKNSEKDKDSYHLSILKKW